MQNNFCKIAVKTCFFFFKKRQNFTKFSSEILFTSKKTLVRTFSLRKWIPGGKTTSGKLPKKYLSKPLTFFGRVVASRYFHQMDFFSGWWGKVLLSPQNIYCWSSVGGGKGEGCVELGSVGIAAPLLESRKRFLSRRTPFKGIFPLFWNCGWGQKTAKKPERTKVFDFLIGD